MTSAERLKKVESEIAEHNIRLSGIGGGGGGNHNLLSATHPDTDPDSPVRGDILRGNAVPEWERYAIGAAGRFLRSDGNDPSWQVFGVGDLPAHAAEHEIGGGDLVNHNNLTNYDANEHVDHTAITLTAGEGLQGGGTIAANRTFDLDVNGLVEDAAGASGDFFVYYDTVAGDHKKIDWDDMPGGGGASPWTEVVNDIYWDGTGHCTIGTINPDSKMATSGFNIYTSSASDTLHFVIQNQDVNHGFTAYCDADSYFVIQKNNDASGGAWVAGLCDATGTGMRLWGLANLAGSSSTTAATGLIDFAAAKRSGSGGTKAGDTDNCFAWVNWTTCIMLLKGRGDLIFPDSQCRIFLGDSINTFQNSGITINQKTYDDEILSFKSSDVNHGITTQTEYDTYAFFKKMVAASGGLQITGLTELVRAVGFTGIATTEDNTRGDGADASVILASALKLLTNVQAQSADANIVVIANYSTEIWGCQGNGDTWQIGSKHYMPSMQSGANQGAAGAAAGELWHDTTDDTVKMGV